MIEPSGPTARDKSKSPNHALAGRLAAEAGLNPAQIRVVLDALADHLGNFYSGRHGPGVVSHCAVSAREPAGKPIKDCQIVPVQLTIMHEADVEVRRQKGTVELRTARLYRICSEAREQGGLLSYEDLAVLLSVTTSAVQDYVRTLRGRGVLVPTRGKVKDIGPDPSHKRLIAELLGRGHSTSQVRAMTKHSEGAIGRYQQQFALVVYLIHEYPAASDDERCILSGLSRAAYHVYAGLYRELADKPECTPHLERLRRRYELDPEGFAFKLPAGKAPKDDSQRRLEQQTLTTAVRQTIQEDLGTTEFVATKVAADLMQLVDDSFLLTDSVRPGEVLAFVDAHDGSLFAGERRVDRQVLPVRLPLFTDETLDVWRKDEPAGRRRARIAVKLACAAQEQGAIMSVAKLSELMHVPPSTMGKDLRELAVACHVEAPTMGLIEDAGPTLTHKDWIVGLDHYGLTGEEISYLTRHAPQSRDRYIETYRRAETLMRLEGRIPDAELLARLLRLRTHVAQQYVDLLRRYHRDGENTPHFAPTPTTDNE